MIYFALSSREPAFEMCLIQWFKHYWRIRIGSLFMLNRRFSNVGGGIRVRRPKL
ncbi:hypothetical protein HanRHA438_Chr10g0436971 [Helianthus annuus]|nr:hypothetical protein HanOQP8_Chr10g0353251 [Helianthus annuus]KAJ0878199.1 hypothetical protein HanRHA438_Chr10g0436971 [Helianthus annuus]KAJ0882470.1 hypothetical protein HanPSC8_Chr10g0410011 [Helianthus annuus]